MKKQAKIPPQHAMATFQVKSLTAISLWVKVKIVHGIYDDVRMLMIEDVATLVREEVCLSALVL